MNHFTNTNDVISSERNTNGLKIYKRKKRKTHHQETKRIESLDSFEPHDNNTEFNPNKYHSYKYQNSKDSNNNHSSIALFKNKNSSSIKRYSRRYKSYNNTINTEISETTNKINPILLLCIKSKDYEKDNIEECKKDNEEPLIMSKAVQAIELGENMDLESTFLYYLNGLNEKCEVEEVIMSLNVIMKMVSNEKTLYYLKGSELLKDLIGKLRNLLMIDIINDMAQTKDNILFIYLSISIIIYIVIDDTKDSKVITTTNGIYLHFNN